MIHSNYPKEVLVSAIEKAKRQGFLKPQVEGYFIQSVSSVISPGEMYLYKKRNELLIKESEIGTTRPYPLLTKEYHKGYTTTQLATVLEECLDINQERNTMSKANQRLRNQTLYLMDGIVSVNVKFHTVSTTEYTYLALANEVYEENSLVLVPDVERDGQYKTAIVVSTEDIPAIDEESNIEYKFIAGKFNGAKYEDLLSRVDIAVEQFSKARHRAKRESYRAAIIAESGGDASMLSLCSPDKE